ncbi:hypothetical protein U1Q18_007295 [Sarracenia purpurea var. burkii]
MRIGSRRRTPKSHGNSLAQTNWELPKEIFESPSRSVCCDHLLFLFCSPAFWGCVEAGVSVVLSLPAPLRFFLAASCFFSFGLHGSKLWAGPLLGSFACALSSCCGPVAA